MMASDESHIRLATPADAADIHAIYAPVVRETIISFEYEEPSVDEMARRIEKVTARYPWLVWVEDGRAVGYAYAGQHNERAAYDWSVDLSAYIHADWRGRGIGKALYTKLYGLLDQLGYINAYAGISLPNTASVALHEAMGMRPVGVYHHVGYKFGKWHDVGWWEGAITPLRGEPAQPLGIASLA